MFPDDRVYTKCHEWVRRDGSLVEVGVTAPLLKKICPILSLELPDPDDELKLELPFGELEGIHETFQLYPPFEARIVEINEELLWSPSKLEADPYGKGWLLKMRLENPAELDRLMDARAYHGFCADDLGEEFVDE